MAVFVFAECGVVRAQDTVEPMPVPLESSSQVSVVLILPQVMDVRPSRQGTAGHIRVAVAGQFPDGPIPDATANWGSSMSGTPIALLGIAAGNGSISRGIDAKKHPKPNQLRSTISGLTQREKALNTAVTHAHVADAPRLDMQLQEVVTERNLAHSTLMAQTGQESTTSGSFWLDVNSDASGVAIHRLQAAVWSLMLGGVFAMLTVRDLAMPNFHSSMLALAGLPSAAYMSLQLLE